MERIFFVEKARVSEGKFILWAEIGCFSYESTALEGLVRVLSESICLVPVDIKTAYTCVKKLKKASTFKDLNEILAFYFDHDFIDEYKWRNNYVPTCDWFTTLKSNSFDPTYYRSVEFQIDEAKNPMAKEVEKYWRQAEQSEKEKFKQRK